MLLSRSMRIFYEQDNGGGNAGTATGDNASTGTSSNGGGNTGGTNSGGNETNTNAGSTQLTTGASTGTGTPKTTSTPEWAAGLPDDLRSNPSLANHKDLPSFIKSALDAEKLIGKKGIIKPDKNASQEEWNKYYTEIGRPEKAEGYEFKRPESWPKELEFSEAMIPKVQEMFYKHGIGKETAKALWEDYHGIVAEEGMRAVGVSKEEVEKGIQNLKKELGGEDKYKAHLETAVMAVKEFGGDDLINFLDSSGLGNHPALIKAFGEAGKYLREDGIVGGRTGGGSFTPEKAKAEIARLEQDNEFQRVLFSTEASDRAKQKENHEIWERLHKLAYPTL
jgi:hypothetical protein